MIRTLQDLSDFVADLINKHGPKVEVMVDEARLPFFYGLSNNYKVYHYEEAEDINKGEAYLVIQLIDSDSLEL